MERKTRQRSAVLRALAETRQALAPVEICALAQRDVARLSLSTVYRQLKDLVDEALVLRVELPGQPTRYEAPLAARGHESDHHHHFHCNACDRVFPIRGCPGPMKQLAPKGFRVEGHEITLHGSCSQCASAAGARAAARRADGALSASRRER